MKSGEPEGVPRLLWDSRRNETEVRGSPIEVGAITRCVDLSRVDSFLSGRRMEEQKEVRARRVGSSEVGEAEKRCRELLPSFFLTTTTAAHLRQPASWLKSVRTQLLSVLTKWLCV